MHISHHCAQRAHRQHPTYIYPPKCWLDISNTNLYIQFTINPKMLAVYILHNLYNLHILPGDTCQHNFWFLNDSQEFRLRYFWRSCVKSLRLPRMHTLDEINFWPRSGPWIELLHIFCLEIVHYWIKFNQTIILKDAIPIVITKLSNIYSAQSVNKPPWYVCPLTLLPTIADN